MKLPDLSHVPIWLCASIIIVAFIPAVAGFTHQHVATSYSITKLPYVVTGSECVETLPIATNNR